MTFRRTLAVSVFAGLLIFLPTAVFAHNGLTEGIVPSESICGGEGGPYFQGADLIHLVQHVIEFAIYLSVFVATLMFVYAGFLYVTAAARTENLQKARSVFTSTFIGLVLILTAWLIVDIILSVLTEKDFGYWSEIQCEDFPTLGDASPTTVGGVTGSGGSRGGGIPYDAGAEASARAQLSGVTINNDPCLTPQPSGCTNVGGLYESAINGILIVNSLCPNTVVTGGTEQGPHRTHTGSGVDFRNSDPNFVSCINSPEVRAEAGISRIIDEGDHLHVEFGGGG